MLIFLFLILSSVAFLQFRKSIQIPVRLVSSLVLILGYELKATDLNISIHTESMWRKRMVVSSKQLCVLSSGMDYCHDLVNVSIQFQWYMIFPLVDHIGPLQISSARLKIRKASERTSKSLADYREDIKSMNQFIRNVGSISQFDIDFADLSLPFKSDQMRLRGRIEWKGFHGGKFQSLTAEFTEIGGSQLTQHKSIYLKYEATKNDHSSDISPEDMPSFEGVVRSKVDQIKFSLKESKVVLDEKSYSLKFSYERGPHLLRLISPNIVYSDWKMKATYDLNYNYFGVIPNSADLKNCRINLNFPKMADKSTLKLTNFCDGSLRINTHSDVASKSLMTFLEIPIILNVSSELKNNHWEYKFLLESQREKKLAGLMSSFIDANFFFQLVSTGSKDNSTTGSFDSVRRLSANVNVFDFKKLKSFLVRMGLLLPAPFNQLEGGMNCSVKDKYRVNLSNLFIPINCKIDLKSDFQIFDIDLDLDLNLKRQNEQFLLNTDMRLGVNNVLFPLPDFNPRDDFPVFIVDKRIIRESLKNKVSAGSGRNLPKPLENISYTFSIKTQRPSSLRLSHKLFDTPVPIDLDLTFSSDRDRKGYLLIKNYQLMLFQHRGILEKFLVTFDGKGNSNLDSIGRIELVDHTVIVTMGGDINKVYFHTRSEPPMQESQLLSRLLFGSEVDELSEDKVGSIESMRAAMASGAVNLLSMYYLASTPITSIGYNSKADRFTASFELKEGLVLQLGAGLDTGREFLLKKRLGKNLTIETGASFNNSGESTKKSGATIRWGKRY